MKVTQRQLEDLSLLYVILNLFEYVLRLNYEFLNDMAKIKFSSVLNGAKWLNKQAEQKLDDKHNEHLGDDANELYTICRKLIEATKHGQAEQFIQYINRFEVESHKF